MAVWHLHAVEGDWETTLNHQTTNSAPHHKLKESQPQNCGFPFDFCLAPPGSKPTRKSFRPGDRSYERCCLGGDPGCWVGIWVTAETLPDLVLSFQLFAFSWWFPAIRPLVFLFVSPFAIKCFLVEWLTHKLNSLSADQKTDRPVFGLSFPLSVQPSVTFRVPNVWPRTCAAIPCRRSSSSASTRWRAGWKPS